MERRSELPRRQLRLQLVPHSGIEQPEHPQSDRHRCRDNAILRDGIPARSSGVFLDGLYDDHGGPDGKSWNERIHYALQQFRRC